ncbi:hypothetical protein M8C21_016758 [Ambrosia artemisiifolia]|uniref:Uncharacterized protein n=1 Tax=Ambrosia artemisiifolia TaxID=4212 RepID=A0AAD5CCS9_AMBAR|nr:hypothetical protein M8C21_016758 [Ambrosia artemisiifolia]
MTTSKRLADRKVERFDKNIKKRGLVPETSSKKKDSYPVGPIVLGFFIFVVIGSYNPHGNQWRHGVKYESSVSPGNNAKTVSNGRPVSTHGVR